MTSSNVSYSQSACEGGKRNRRGRKRDSKAGNRRSTLSRGERSRTVNKEMRQEQSLGEGGQGGGG